MPGFPVSPAGRIAGAAALLVLGSAAYQTWASFRDRRRFPAPGRLVEVGGGRRVHLWCAGAGSPAVVIVPALGEPSVTWAGVLPRLAAETSVVVYDRAGLGWSDPAPGGRAAGTMLAAALDLRKALDRAGIAAPCVLVGHSVAGFLVRLYAALYPEDVAAVVLVDSSHEEQHRRLPHYPVTILKWWARDRLRPYGLRRLAFALGVRRPPYGRHVPAEWAGAATALALGDRQRRAGLRELAAFTRSAAQVGRHAPSLGRIPLTVLSSSRDAPGVTSPRRIAARREMYRVWLPLQRDLAALSADSTHVVAEHAGHHIHHDDPDLVVRAVLGRVAEARTALAAPRSSGPRPRRATPPCR
ncbi:pimeloyl-ACP methyl ester carboxylesterase [Thermocatellispora tengchongensis]|uniref:Pimeloyl-ACP methyl ester carboxylesterase n=1 Tax=Thermocatellispora tengchongensis TaxID=1073253 RepID=A0A840NSV1_9ACTN|nr:alpha/beta fold hydrolase [Thermocatellispora tengchongensis]MBB5130332.1 pimeloyl-ACP methyl ester carboxylesterase [Thermocatellispora tengchongensis]